MSEHSHDVAAEVRKYMIVFGALLVGTVITVLAAKIDFGSHSVNVGVALLIATVKGFLVAAYFMHLISERKMIYSILVATVFFVIGLFYLTIWSMNPISVLHYKHAGDPATAVVGFQ